MFVDVSAKQHLNIEELLEAVLLTADAALDLRANPDKDARGVAIEANSTVAEAPRRPSWSNREPCASAMRSSLERPRPSAPCSMSMATTSSRRARPVPFRCSASPRSHGLATPSSSPRRPHARQIAEKRKLPTGRPRWPRPASGSPSKTQRGARCGQVDTLNLILKGDVSGSVEALRRLAPDRRG